MPKKVYRPPTNEATAQITVMETIAKAGRPLWAYQISEMADLAIHAVYGALYQLRGICVEKQESGWAILPEPSDDLPLAKVLIKEDVGADKIEDLLIWLKENQIEYSSVGYARLVKKAYYEISCLAKDLRVGGAIESRKDGIRNTIVKVEHLGYFKNRLYAIDDCVKVSCAGNAKKFLSADETVFVRYYYP